MPTPITRHVVLITGFRQKSGRATTGLDSLFHELHSRLAEPGVAIWQREWSDDMRALAGQINRYRLAYDAEIIVVGYSWGVGYGALRFANELRHYGLSIKCLYSIDGVYRHWTRIRSMFSRWNPLAPKIHLPTNADACIYWRQVNNYPQGHEIVPTLGPDKQIVVPGNDDDGKMPRHTHQTIDNSPTILTTIAEKIAEGWA